MSPQFITLTGKSPFTGKKADSNTEKKTAVSTSVKKIKTTTKKQSNKMFKAPVVKASVVSAPEPTINLWECLAQHVDKPGTKSKKAHSMTTTKKATQKMSPKKSPIEVCAAGADSTKNSFELQSSKKEVIAALRLVNEAALDIAIASINPKSTKAQLNDKGIRITTSPDIAGRVNNTYAVMEIPMNKSTRPEQRMWLVEKIRRAKYDQHNEDFAREIVVYHTLRTLKVIHRAIRNLSAKKSVADDLNLIIPRMYSRERLKALYRERTQKIRRNAEINEHLNALSKYLDKTTMTNIRNEIVCSTI